MPDDSLEDLDFYLTDDTTEFTPECPSVPVPATASVVSRRLLDVEAMYCLRLSTNHR